uniref:Uncharacterized protein n=1 Tax=Picocystis salinarum TaxID=88271 RepID=A0A7S3XG06_9CHLO
MADDGGDAMRTSTARTAILSDADQEGGEGGEGWTKRKHAYVDDVADEEEEEEDEEEEEEVRRIASRSGRTDPTWSRTERAAAPPSRLRSLPRVVSTRIGTCAWSTREA